MNNSPKNASFAAAEAVYTHKINRGAKLQGELRVP